MHTAESAMRCSLPFPKIVWFCTSWQFARFRGVESRANSSNGMGFPQNTLSTRSDRCWPKIENRCWEQRDNDNDRAKDRKPRYISAVLEDSDANILLVGARNSRGKLLYGRIEWEIPESLHAPVVAEIGT